MADANNKCLKVPCPADERLRQEMRAERLRAILEDDVTAAVAFGVAWQGVLDALFFKHKETLP